MPFLWENERIFHHPENRFRIFREHLKEIVEINDAQEDYELDANFMAGLTSEEQEQW